MGENKNDFFDFDMETNIMDKLETQNDKIIINESSNNKNLINKKRKQSNINTWSYDNILSEEKKIQKIKETKKNKELGLSPSESKINEKNDKGNNIPLI